MKNFIKKIIPNKIIQFYRNSIHKKNANKYQGKSLSETFTQIYTTNQWHSEISVSGTGSDFIQTKVLIDELPKLFEKYKIQSIIDIPCGDFNWMNNVDLSKVKYLGADIVEDIIVINQKKFARENVSFEVLDLTKDDLPQVDLIFCRDCLVHLSYENIFKAFENIVKSNSKYLLTTSFKEKKSNRDIVTGNWRPINLQIAPFNLPFPTEIIIENCTEGNGEFKDKSLMLWEIKDIKL